MLAEAQYLSASGRVRSSFREVLGTVLSDGRFATYDLTTEVLTRVDTRLEMHDAIICATALLLRDVLDEEVRVITRDRQITASGIVETVW